MTVAADTTLARRHAFLEQAGLAAVFGVAGALQFSIAVAQILLTVAVVCWLALIVIDRETIEVPRFAWPLGLYAVLTLISTAFSPDPRTSLLADKQMILFLLVPLVYRFATGSHASTMVTVIVSFAAASAIVGIVQFGVLHYDNLGRRAQGTLGHYMTYSGLLMLVIGTALARVLFGRRERMWSALVIPALAVAVAFSFSRNAGVGACAAAALLLFLKDRRLLALLPIVAAVFVLIAPTAIANRYASIFSLKNPTNRDRVAMAAGGRADDQGPSAGRHRAEHGAATLRAVPGPGSRQSREPPPAQRAHPDRRGTRSAGARGLAVVRRGLVAALWKRQRDPSQRFLAAVGLSAVVSMLAAGMFEYNFGDSEFLMLFLILVTLPFAAGRTLTRQSIT